MTRFSVVTEPERTMRLTARSTYPANPWEIDYTIDLQHLTVDQYSAGVAILHRLRNMLDHHWREVAYADGESSGAVDWSSTLSEVLPERGPDWEWTPQTVAAYIRAEQQRLQ